MKKVDPKKLNFDMRGYEKTPPWYTITSAKLAKALGVHLQTINNWKMRNPSFPQPVTNNPKLRGNKNYFLLASIFSWLSGRSESEITAEWLAKYIGQNCTPAQADHLIKAVGLKNL